MSKFFIGISILIFTISCNERRRDKNSVLLKQVRMSLYETDIEKGDSIMGLVDSIGMDEIVLGYYYLTKGFLLHKNGQAKKSANYIEKASNIISQHGTEEEKAELNLIWGLIFEDSYLLSESAKSFFVALNYYQNHTKLSEYFYTLLGLARTSSINENFLINAEKFLLKNSGNRYQTFYYQTKALCVDNLMERQNLFQKALKFNDVNKNTRNELNLYTSLSLNSFMLNRNDSAFYYLKKADDLVRLNAVPSKRLVHYYLIKTYINVEVGNLEAATQAVGHAISNASELHGLLGQAYRQKYFIESSYKNYKIANDYLLKYVTIEKKELQFRQENQLSLLSVLYELQLKESEITRIKLYWLAVSLTSILLFIIIVSIFIIYRKKASALIKELKYRLNITTNRLEEQIVHNVENVKETSKFNVSKYGQKRNNYSKGDWPGFIAIFRIRYPLFEDKLKKTYPKLSAYDIKYCICIFSGLTNFQIGELLVISSDAVRKAKKKLQLIFNINKPGEVILHLNKFDRNTITSPLKDK